MSSSSVDVDAASVIVEVVSVPEEQAAGRVDGFLLSSGGLVGWNWKRGIHSLA